MGTKAKRYHYLLKRFCKSLFCVSPELNRGQSMDEQPVSASASKSINPDIDTKNFAFLRAAGLAGTIPNLVNRRHRNNGDRR